VQGGEHYLKPRKEVSTQARKHFKRHEQLEPDICSTKMNIL
jgi:hypothetical protein